MALDPFYDMDPMDLNRLLSEPVRNYAIVDIANSEILDIIAGTAPQASALLTTMRANQLASGDPSQLKGMLIKVATEEEVAAWEARGA